MAEIVLDILKTYLVGAVIGFIVGIFVARFYFKSSIRQRELGRVIECAMIQKNVSNLEFLSNTLNQLVSEIQEESEILSSQLKLAQDIELNLRPNQNNGDETQEEIIPEEETYVTIEINNNIDEIAPRAPKNISRIK